MLPVHRAPENDGVVGLHVVDLVGGDHRDLEATLGEDVFDRRRDLGGRAGSLAAVKRTFVVPSDGCRSLLLGDPLNQARTHPPRARTRHRS